MSDDPPQESTIHFDHETEKSGQEKCTILESILRKLKFLKIKKLHFLNFNLCKINSRCN